jgi:Domain of unknown function (DUF4282)
LLAVKATLPLVRSWEPSEHQYLGAVKKRLSLWRRAKRQGGRRVGDLLAFRTLITGSVIQHVYAVGVVALMAAGILTLFSGQTGVAIGIAILTLGNLLWRLACEGTIVFFRMHDALASIDDSMGTAEEDLSVLSGRASQEQENA